MYKFNTANIILISAVYYAIVVYFTIVINHHGVGFMQKSYDFNMINMQI